MTNCIFYTLFFALFLNLSFGSLRMSQVNRAFMSIYKGMLEASVLTIDDNGEPVVPYYNQEALSTYVEDYLEKNISKYTTNYAVDVDYFDHLYFYYCQSECRKVNINLRATINVFYKYDKTQTFVVRSAEDYE